MSRPDEVSPRATWAVAGEVRDERRQTADRVFRGCLAYTAALVLCLWAVLSHGLPWPWIGLSVAVAALSTVLELVSPRGTDDFTMATGNALLCWAFGALLY